jgi:hypothetical protein
MTGRIVLQHGLSEAGREACRSQTPARKPSQTWLGSAVQDLMEAASVIAIRLGRVDEFDQAKAGGEADD